MSEFGSRFGQSNQHNPLRLALGLRGRFIMVVIVDPRAVNVRAAVRRAGGQFLDGSYTRNELEGWVVSGLSFHTDGTHMDLTLEGYAFSDSHFDTAVLLFSQP